MGALTADQPKCFTELQGRSLLQWQLDAMAGACALPVGIVRGYLSRCFDAFGSAHFDNPRWAETQMVRSLLCADTWLSDDEALVSYSDIIYSPETAKQVANADGDLVIAYHTGWRALWEARFDDPLSDAETFRAGDDGHLIEIGGKAESMDQIRGQYMGLITIRPAGWRAIREHVDALEPAVLDRLDMTSLLSQLVARGVKIQTVPISGLWYEVDTESDWRLYQSMLEA
jgi:choline kinase